MAEEKGRVLLFGRRWSGKTTLANMLVSGEIRDCPLNPTDIDSICKTYVGRGWTVVDTMGFGDPLDYIAPDEYATEMGIAFLNEVRGSYSHIIFVLDGREVTSEPGPSVEDYRKGTLSMWKTFLEIFRGGEERFVILVTKVTPHELTWRAWQGISREVMERFPECKRFLCSNFFNEDGGGPGHEAVVLKGEALTELEKGMEEICEGRPWVEPNVTNMGEDEIEEMASRITHQITASSVGDSQWEMGGSTYKIQFDYKYRPKGASKEKDVEEESKKKRESMKKPPEPMWAWSYQPSQKQNLERIVKIVLKIWDDMQILGKEVKLYPQQCEYLLKRTKDAANEIHDVIYGNEMKWDEDHCLQPLNRSLSKVWSCMEAGRELLHLCGEGVDEEVVLTMSFRIDSRRNLFSKFAMVLRDLEWFLDVFRFWWHIVKAEDNIEIEWLSWRSKFSWCETRCRLVYVEDGENRVVGTDYVESGVVGDNKRHAQDQQVLISSIENHFRNPKKVLDRYTDFFLRWAKRMEPSDSERSNYISVFKNRLQGDSTFQGPSSSSNSNMVPKCFQIPGNHKFKSIQLIGWGIDKEVFKCKWLGMNVALATSKRGRVVIEAEAEMLARVQQHPNVVTLIGYTYDEEKQKGFLVTELLPTSLESIINNAMFNPLSWKRIYPFSIIEAIDILLQIVEAMIHVHECGVIHGDLKPENCLCNCKVDRTLHQVRTCVDMVKLIDFGSAEMDSKLKTPSINGTPPWMAPEVYGRIEDLGGNMYTFSADVYSFGMICYRVITGNQPFGRLRGRALRHKVCDGHRPEIPSNCPNELKELMTECWVHNAKDRPTFKAIQRRMWNFKLDYSIWK